jgi:hypothetical protein
MEHKLEIKKNLDTIYRSLFQIYCNSKLLNQPAVECLDYDSFENIESIISIPFYLPVKLVTPTVEAMLEEIISNIEQWSLTKKSKCVTKTATYLTHALLPLFLNETDLSLINYLIKKASGNKQDSLFKKEVITAITRNLFPDQSPPPNKKKQITSSYKQRLQQKIKDNPYSLLFNETKSATLFIINPYVPIIMQSREQENPAQYLTKHFWHTLIDGFVNYNKIAPTSLGAFFNTDTVSNTNAEFTYLSLSPLPFIICKIDVLPGEEILVDYGPARDQHTLNAITTNNAPKQTPPSPQNNGKSEVPMLLPQTKKWYSTHLAVSFSSTKGFYIEARAFIAKNTLLGAYNGTITNSYDFQRSLKESPLAAHYHCATNPNFLPLSKKESKKRPLLQDETNNNSPAKFPRLK